MSLKAKYDQDLQQQIAANDWRKVIQTCQEYELENLDAVNNPPNYGIHLFAYLIIGDLTNARFLYKRIPDPFKKNQIIQDIWNLGKQMFQRNYPEIYKALNGNWDSYHQPLIQILTDAFRRRTIELISKAYTTISVADTSVYLGLNPNDTVALMTQRGWVLDAASNTFAVKPLFVQKRQQVALRQLEQLTDYFSYLEQ